jgi:hypothetical protein
LLNTSRSSFVIQALKLSRLTSADLRTVSIHMNEHESFSDSIYEEQTHLAERELSSFIAAVTELYGPEQARLSEKDWLDESELMDSPPVSTSREWRAVTIAASARLAGIDAVLYLAGAVTGEVIHVDGGSHAGRW